MIDYLNNAIGRQYTPLYDGSAVVSGIAGVDFTWIAAAICLIICVYFTIKLFCRLFIGK